MTTELPATPALLSRRRSFDLVQVGLYVLMCSIWGSSFFFTAIALRGFNAVTIPTLRMLLASVALAAVVAVRRLPLPRQPALWGHVLVLGVFNIALPYLLLTQAQLYVNSSTATVLSATTPLFVFLISWLVARTERFGALRALGLVTAFIGLVSLYGADRLPGAADVGPWAVVIVLCSVFYAAGNVYTRVFLNGIHPFMVALLQVGAGAACLLAYGLWTGTLSIGTADPGAWLALLELGLAGSALTYLLFFHFIRRWGSTATSLNTYFQPIVGLTLGVTLLHDSIAPLGWVALGVVFLGIALFGVGSVRRPALPTETLPQ